MKWMAPILFVTVLTACGESAAEQARNAALSAAPDAAYQSEETRRKEVQATIKQIRYSPCENLTNNEKPTSCGVRVLDGAVSECAARALKWSGGTAVLDKYAGDSWINAVGPSMVQSTEERANFEASTGGGDSGVEFVAIIMGNGQRALRRFSCGIDDRWHLSDMSDGGLVQVPEDF